MTEGRGTRTEAPSSQVHEASQPMGVKEVVVTSDPYFKTPPPLSARPHLTTAQNTEEEDEEGGREEEVYRRGLQRERLNTLLLKLRHV